MSKVKLGLEALQTALPTLPMGSQLHNAVLKAIGDISKHMQESPNDSSAVIQQLVQLARQQQQQPQQQSAMRAMMPGGGAPQG